MSSTPYIPSITIDNVISALGAFIQPFVGMSTPIIRAQVNRVNMPVGPFVQIRELRQTGLDTPTQLQNSNPSIQQASIGRSITMQVQIDFYGPSAGEWATAIETVFRSPYAPDQFPSGMAPLDCSDASQGPLITGEEQYEYRWVLTASVEYNPVVVVPQQSATQLETNIFEDLE